MSNASSLRILIVDDEKNIRSTLSVSLEDLGHEVHVAASLDEAIYLLRSTAFDLLLTDYRLGGPTGSDVLREAKRLQPEAVVIVMTAFSSIENAIQVTKEGAFDYLQKPFTNAQLEFAISKASKVISLQRDLRDARAGGPRLDLFDGYASLAIKRLEDFVSQVAPTDETVLLTGESGTGKSELAKVIHQRSRRREKPFVTVYCTTIAESVLESELFGHVKGAFTGATHDKAGKLETANGGTLFLDEVGELSNNAQSKLLRFLQDRVIERVGATSTIPVDARILAATNKDLRQAVEDGTFREDLYYRLNVLECELVPLRHRKEDLPLLIQQLLLEAAKRQGRTAIPSLGEGALERLLSYRWPGNVRELKNCIERLMILSRGDEIQVADLPSSITSSPPSPNQADRPTKSLDEIEREHIAAVLATEPNQERAAHILGITTVTLWRKRKQYGLP